MVQTVCQSYSFKHFFRFFQSGFFRLSEHERDRDVFKRREFGQKVVELENYADLAVSERTQFRIGKLRGFFAFEQDLSAVGLFQSRHDVEQSRLPRSAFSGERKVLAFFHFKIHAAEDVDPVPFDEVGFFYVFQS